MLLISLICHTPIVIRGYLCGFVTFSMIWQWKTSEKPVLVCPIDGYQSKCLPDGGIQWLLVKPWPPPLDDVRGIVPPHRNGHQNGPQSRCIYSLLCGWLSPWRSQERYGASSCPVAASSGSRYGPGHHSLGDATWIASMPLHGHQNCLQWRCICLLPPPFSFSIFEAKDHVMVRYNSKQATLLLFTMLFISSYLIGHDRWQWTPFRPPLSSTGKWLY